MARHQPQRGPYRCHVVMPDGSVTVLFASTATPEAAASIVRATFAGEKVQAAKIQVYGDDSTEPHGPVLLEWTAP